MTKTELYNKICQQLPHGNEENDLFSEQIKQLYSLVEKEFKNHSPLYAAEIEDLIISYSLRYGVFTALNEICGNYDINIDDDNLFENFMQELKIDLHNFRSRANRPRFKF